MRPEVARRPPGWVDASARLRSRAAWSSATPQRQTSTLNGTIYRVVRK